MKVGDIVYWAYFFNRYTDAIILKGKVTEVREWNYVTVKVISSDPPYLEIQRNASHFVFCKKEAIEDEIRRCQMERGKAQRRIDSFIRREKLFEELLTKVDDSGATEDPLANTVKLSELEATKEEEDG